MSLTLRDYQKQSLAKLIHTPRMLDRSQAGTGKTAPACVYTRYVVGHLKKRVVWIQPTSLIDKNHKEILMWTGLQEHEVVKLAGTRPKKLEILKDNRIKVFLCTAEAFADYMLAYWPDLKGSEVFAIICDEPHMYYRGYNSKRCQKFDTVCQRRPDIEVKFLTATPTPYGKLTSAYIYCRVIEPMFYKTYRFFQGTHEILDLFGSVTGWQNHEVLNQFLARYSICHTAHQVYGDVEEYIVRQTVKLLGKHEEVYRQFEEMGVLELQDSIDMGTAPAQSTLRCRQILNHPHNIQIPIGWDVSGKPAEFENLNLTKGKETGKDKLLAEYMAEGNQIAIFAPFVFEQEHIKEYLEGLGYKGGLINGSVSAVQRNQVDTEFREGKLDFVIASPQTAATGFNWGFLNTVIFHSMDYGDDGFTQAIARAKRGVRENPLRIVILEYENTIEQLMLVKIRRSSIDSNKVSPECPVLTFPRYEGEEKAP